MYVIDAHIVTIFVVRQYIARGTVEGKKGRSAVTESFQVGGWIYIMMDSWMDGWLVGWLVSWLVGWFDGYTYR